MKGCSSMTTLITPESGTDWDHVDLFLAGGISNCPDWQNETVQMLDGLDLFVANPRRSYGLEKTGDAAAKQIAWEHEMLSRAAVTLFWFSAGAIQPIALLELGRKMTEDKPLVVGVDEFYERRFDVEQQLWLEREQKPLYSLIEVVSKATEECYRARGLHYPKSI